MVGDRRSGECAPRRRDREEISREIPWANTASPTHTEAQLAMASASLSGRARRMTVCIPGPRRSWRRGEPFGQFAGGCPKAGGEDEQGREPDVAFTALDAFDLRHVQSGRGGEAPAREIRSVPPPQPRDVGAEATEKIAGRRAGWGSGGHNDGDLRRPCTDRQQTSGCQSPCRQTASGVSPVRPCGSRPCAPDTARHSAVRGLEPDARGHRLPRGQGTDVLAVARALSRKVTLAANGKPPGGQCLGRRMPRGR